MCRDPLAGPIPLARRHCVTRLLRRDVNWTPAHRVAPLLHSNGGVVPLGKDLGITLCETRIPFVRPG